MPQHTHRLARGFSYPGADGKRVHGMVGDPYTPTLHQLRNMPDCFVEEGGGTVAAPTDDTGVKGMAVAASEDLVETIEGLRLRRKGGREEGGGRDRKGGQRHISDRIVELEDGNDGEGGKEGGEDD